MRRAIGIGLAMVGVLGAGCGGDAPTGLVVGGNGDVVVTVSSGVLPTISWTGGPARRLSVTRNQGGGVFWDLQAVDEEAGFGAPVTHGVAPTGARELADAVTLDAGVDYRVDIDLVDGSGGARVFRP